MRTFAVLVMLSVVMLNACSELTVRTHTALPPVIDAGRRIDGWLAEMHGMRDLPPELQQQALETRELESCEGMVISRHGHW